MGKTQQRKNRKHGKKQGKKRQITRGATALRARAMTNNLFLKLKYATDLTITALSSWRFGLAQFWGQIPGYYAEYMKIYKMSRILSVRVKVVVINTTANTPAEIILVELPYSDYSKTIDQVKQLPKAAIRYLSGSGGIDKVSLTKSASLNRNLGVDSRSIRDFQQSASEASSTLALLPDTPVLALYVGGASTEPTLRVFIEVMYDIEFFEPEYPGSVAFSQNTRVAADLTSKADKMPDIHPMSSFAKARKPERYSSPDEEEAGIIDSSESDFSQPQLRRTAATRKQELPKFR